MAAVGIASRQKSSSTAGGPTDRPKPTDSTRYLCAAVYFDRKFRNRVIREIVDEEQRAIGTSPGLDLVMVVEHALAVSRRKFRRDIWLALLLFVASSNPSSLPRAESCRGSSLLPSALLREAHPTAHHLAFSLPAQAPGMGRFFLINF